MKTQCKKKFKKQKYVYVNINGTHYDSVKNALLAVGYKFTTSETKNLLFWGDSEGSLEDVQRLNRWQFYNHFPGMWHIAHKVELAKNLGRIADFLPELYNFHPKTFILPFQINDLTKFMNNIPSKKERTVIVKPDRGSQGKGIILIQDADNISNYSESAVAQQYIPPLLIDGYKFDLRIYVLITSIDPLILYVYNEGMARFCTELYQPPNSKNLKAKYSHLTNFSLNKKNPNFESNDDDDANSGSKRSLTSVLVDIEKMGFNKQKVIEDIDQIIRLTLISGIPHLTAAYHTGVTVNDGKSRCFEIMGFDILLDHNARPWLLETNSMPSLSTGSPFDAQLKAGVLEGALKILNLTPSFKTKCQNRFKLISTQRLSGSSSSIIPPLFSLEEEIALSKNTKWRNIYPVTDKEIFQKCEVAMNASKIIPLAGFAEAISSKKRKEIILQQIQQSERQTQLSSSKAFNPEIFRPKSAISETKQDPSLSSCYHQTFNSNSFISTNVISQSSNHNSHITRPQTELCNVRNQQLDKKMKCALNKTSQYSQKKPSAKTFTPRIPKSVILGNEARIRNMISNESIRKSIPFIELYSSLPQNRISSLEERERLHTLRAKAIEASSSSILLRLRILLKESKEISQIKNTLSIHIN